MNVIDEQHLLQLNHLGIIPGPGEQWKEFQERAKACRNVQNDCLLDELPFSRDDFAPVNGGAIATTSGLFDVAPTWVPVFFSNYRLMPWQGGCTWIFQLKEDSAPLSLVQLHKIFKKAPTFLFFYHRDELLAHELCHVSRMAFSEDRFEELMAYQTSKTFFRKIMGPLVRSPTEVVLFFGFLFFALTVPLLDPPLILFWTSIAAVLALLSAALGRLAYTHWQFQRCLSSLTSLVHDRQKALRIMFRLTDDEIIRFGSYSPTDIRSYAASQSCLRWKVISLAYLA